MTIVLAIVLVSLSRAAWAQGHDANWIFSNGIHLKFDLSMPVVMPALSSINTEEAAASISDSNGNLLFYTDNINFWDLNHQLIPSTELLNISIGSDGSSRTNGAIILPWPGDTLDKFFTAVITNELTKKVSYSVFDKESNFGTAGLIDGYISIPLWSSPVAEAINAVRHANGSDWWIIARTDHPEADSLLLALLSSNGVVETISYPISFLTEFGGEMSFSPKGNLFALVASYSSFNKAVAVYNFDRCNGEMALIDTFISNGKKFYGIAFSSNGNNIYVGTLNRPTLLKLSIVDGRIIDSLVYQFPGSDLLAIQGGQLQLGPDERIYWGLVRITSPFYYPDYGKFLAVVSEPNRGMANINFDTFGLFLNGQTLQTWSLPNFPNYDLGPLIGSPCDTLSPVDTTQTNIPVFPQGTATWSVVPTISNGLFAIQGAANGTLMVYDLYGREVFRKSLTNAPSFDLGAFPAGLYWVTVQSEDGIWYPAQKIIRQ